MKFKFRIMHTIVAIILIATTLLTTKVSFAQSGSAIYVNGTSGSNTNDGLTVSTPVKTIQQAITLAKAGYTIYVRAGTYNENLTVTKSGTAAAPITLTRYGSETVIINGGTGIALRASNGASYWVVDGLTIKSTNRYTLQLGFWGEATTNYWTVRNNSIKGANYIVGSYHLWENNNIDGTGYAGTGGDAGISDGSISHHNVYRGNTVHDFTHYNARGIWTQGLTHDSLIENNYVYNIVASSGLGQCIDLDGAGNVEWRHTVRGNTVVNCSYMGIQLENIFASTIENNVIRGGRAGIGIINYNSNVGCAVGGENNQYGDTNGDKNCKGDITNNIIRQNVITTSSYWGAGYGGILNWDAGGLKILGNTIYSPSSSSNAGINFQGTAANTKEGSIIGNIVMNGNGTAVCAQDFASFSSISNNLTFRTNSTKSYGLGSGCSTTYSVAEFQSLTGKGQNSAFGDPLFVNASGNDLHPTSGSPSVDAGVNLGTSTDIEGKNRPAGSTYDIGAYEFDGVAVAKTPTVTPTALATTVTPTVTATPNTSVTPTTNVTPVTTVTVVTPTATSIPPVAELSGKNVAVGKPARQSNDYKSSLYGTAYASRAVDGNVDGTFSNRSVSSTTANTNQAWWQVDLKSSYQLSEIKIWNRSDCCTTRLADFYILVSNRPFSSTNLQTVMKQSGVTSYYVKDTVGRPTSVTINRKGRYVRIQLRSTSSLSLAEVQIFDSSVMAQEVTPVATSVTTTVAAPVAD
ncbi:MAG: choice-of-anchor Q domain-containing protein, partial [Anaerolineaceae bacterium]